MEIEYAEPTELDLKLEKMALFMGCYRKVVKYQEEIWNSSNESYWSWTEDERWVDDSGQILNEEDYLGDSLQYHSDWNWLHPVIAKIAANKKVAHSSESYISYMVDENLKNALLHNHLETAFELSSKLIELINQNK